MQGRMATGTQLSQFKTGPFAGWGSMYTAALPRSPDTFRIGDFGPFEPIPPVPIDVGKPPSGRPQPRRWQYPVGWNLPVGQPGTEGIKLVNFQVLRDYAQISSTVQSIINICRADILNLKWDIIPTEEAAAAMEGNPGKRATWESKRKEVVDFFRNCDPDGYPSFTSWLSAMLYDSLTIDAVAVYLQLCTGGKGNGPLGSNLGALALVDGSTIRPLLDLSGASPRPPQPAYQQNVWGVPRVDLMRLFDGLGPNTTIEDLKQLNPEVEGLMTTVDEYDGDRLIYIRQNPLTNSPYGFGPLEQCILPVSIMLGRQQWQWQFFQSGAVPRVWVDPGSMIATPEEARELQEAINQLGGDLTAQWQVLVLPPGAKTTERSKVDLSDDFDNWITAQITMPFGLSITDLGIVPKMGAMMSGQMAKQSEQGAADRSTRRSTIPRTEVFKEQLFDRIIQRVLGWDDAEWSWGIEEQGENKGDLIDQAVAAFEGSLISLDEARKTIGYDPIGLPATSIPLLFSKGPNPPIPIDQLDEIAQANLETTRAKAELAKNPPPPPALPGGVATPPKPGQTAPNPGQSDGGGASKPQAGAAETPKNQGEAQAGKSFSDTLGLVTAEAEILERHLKKGKSLEEFVPKVFSRSALRSGIRLAGAGDARGAVVAILKTHHRVLRRDAELEAARNRVGEGLGRLVNRLWNSTMSVQQFIRAATAVLQAEMRRAARTGAQHAASDLGVKPEPTNEMADQRTQIQLPQLTRFATAILMSRHVGRVDPGRVGEQATATNYRITVGTLDAQAQQYGNTLTAAYEQGYGDTALTNSDNGIITWRCEDDPCDLCADRCDQDYTQDTLPCWPGDGGFGDFCEGACACRCTLDYSDAGPSESDAFGGIMPDGMSVPDDGSATAPAGVLATASSPLREPWLSGQLTSGREMNIPQHAAAWEEQQRAIIAQLPTTPGVDGSSVAERASARLEARLQLGQETGAQPWNVPAQDVADRVYANTGIRGGIGWTPPDGFTPPPTLSPLPPGPPVPTQIDLTTAPVEEVTPAVEPSAMTTNYWPPPPGAMTIVRKGSVTKALTPDGLELAGIAVIARDTGRVLMVQREFEPDEEKTHGRLEFPGGHIEDGQTPVEAALKEFKEEVGCALPVDGDWAETWTSPDGKYRGYIYLIDSEDQIKGDGGHEMADTIWFEPRDLEDSDTTRDIVRENTDWDLLQRISASVFHHD